MRCAEELLPTEGRLRYEVIEWLFWGSSGFSSQVKLFGFYYHYCPHSLPYCVNRYTREVCRLLEVLEKQLSAHGKHWVVGDMYSVADICIFPWVYALHEFYGGAVEHAFAKMNSYPHVNAWYTRCRARPAVQKGLDVTPFLA